MLFFLEVVFIDSFGGSKYLCVSELDFIDAPESSFPDLLDDLVIVSELFVLHFDKLVPLHLDFLHLDLVIMVF